MTTLTETVKVKELKTRKDILQLQRGDVVRLLSSGSKLSRISRAPYIGDEYTLLNYIDVLYRDGEHTIVKGNLQISELAITRDGSLTIGSFSRASGTKGISRLYDEEDAFLKEAGI